MIGRLRGKVSHLTLKQSVLLFILSLWFLSLPLTVQGLFNCLQGRTEIEAHAFRQAYSVVDVSVVSKDSAGENIEKAKLRGGQHAVGSGSVTVAGDTGFLIDYHSQEENVVRFDQISMAAPFKKELEIPLTAEADMFVFEEPHERYQDKEILIYPEEEPTFLMIRDAEQWNEKAWNQPLALYKLWPVIFLVGTTFLFVIAIALPDKWYQRLEERHGWFAEIREQGYTRVMIFFTMSVFVAVLSVIPIVRFYLQYLYFYMVAISLTVYLASFSLNIVNVKNLYSRKTGFWIFFLSSLPIFLLSALRYDTGFDYSFTFQPWFTQAAEGSRPEIMEPFLYYFYRLVSALGGSFQTTIVIQTFLFLLAVYYVIYKISPYPTLAILLFTAGGMFTSSLTYIGQYAAIALIFLGLPYLKKGHWWKFALLVVIAAQFDETAVLALFFILLIYIHPPYQITLPILAVLTLACKPIASRLWELASKLSIGKYTYYLDVYLISPGIKAWRSSLIVGYLLACLPILILGAIYYKKCTEKNSMFPIFYNATIIIAFLYGAPILILPQSYRIALYFAVAVVLVIPQILSVIPAGKKRIAAGIVLSAPWVIYTILNEFIHNYAKIIPYQSIWG